MLAVLHLQLCVLPGTAACLPLCLTGQLTCVPSLQQQAHVDAPDAQLVVQAGVRDSKFLKVPTRPATTTLGGVRHSGPAHSKAQRHAGRQRDQRL